MIKINLIVLKEMCNKDLSKEALKENATTWIFDSFENNGLGCTGVCSDCMEFEDINF